jgi:hypothetical protein
MSDRIISLPFSSPSPINRSGIVPEDRSRPVEQPSNRNTTKAPSPEAEYLPARPDNETLEALYQQRSSNDGRRSPTAAFMQTAAHGGESRRGRCVDFPG